MDDTTPTAGREEELKSLLMRVKGESERAGLKLNIKKIKIMTSSLFTSWQIEGEKVEVVANFLFLGSKTSADGACSHEIRCLPLGRKAMTNTDSVLKSRDVTLPTQVRIVKAMVFPVIMYGCIESWAIKKAECKESMPLNCGAGKGLLKVPWAVRRSNESILREINLEYSLQNLMLKLKHQYFGDSWMASPTQWA